MGMRTNAEYREECERIDARILSLAAQKARIDAEMAVATEELRKLLEDEFFDYQNGRTPGVRPGSLSGNEAGVRRRTNLADTAAAAEVACLLRIPQRTAHRLVQHAAVLVKHQPRTLAALHAGTISWTHATTLVHECSDLPPQAAAQLEEHLLPIAADTTAARTAVKARTLRARLHPEPLHARATTAAARRRVDLEPDHDAMAWLHIYLPATDATAIDTRLTTTARALQSPTETRTLPHLRTDILTDLLLTPACPARLCPGAENPTAAPRSAGTSHSTPVSAGVGPYAAEPSGARRSKDACGGCRCGFGLLSGTQPGRRRCRRSPAVAGGRRRCRRCRRCRWDGGAEDPGSRQRHRARIDPPRS